MSRDSVTEDFLFGQQPRKDDDPCKRPLFIRNLGSSLPIVSSWLGQVVKGHGPLNKKRLDDRRNAWENGAWVREAATAYASKQHERNASKAS